MKHYVGVFFVLFVCAPLQGMEDVLKVKPVNYRGRVSFSLIAPYNKVQEPDIQTTYQGYNQYNQYLTIGPSIGFYSPNYPFRSFLGLIQLNPGIAAETLPEDIKQALPSLENVETLHYNVIFYGPYIEELQDSWLTNLVFHPWARTWAQQDPAVSFNPKGQDLYFSVKVPMGIFQPDGIMPARDRSGIVFGRLSSQNIDAHGPGGKPDPKELVLLFSPNNARFLVDKNRAISSFWVVAHSPNKKHVVITYVVLANSSLASRNVEGVLVGSATLGDFIKNMEAAQGQGKDALIRVAQNIRAIVTKKRVQPMPPMPEPPAQPVELIQALRNLERALQQLTVYLK